MTFIFPYYGGFKKKLLNFHFNYIIQRVGQTEANGLHIDTLHVQGPQRNDKGWSTFCIRNKSVLHQWSTFCETNTCNAFSSRHLHISSQRLRTDESNTGFIPAALADWGKKSRAKILLMTIARGWWLDILLKVSATCSVFLVTSRGTELLSLKVRFCQPEGSSNQNS